MTGLFFGSFNPIHNGHLAIARYLLDNGYCREIWFVISPRNPLKEDTTLLPEALRLQMVEAAIADDPRMKACDIEFSMPRPSYTIDTLKKISSAWEGMDFALIIGGDNLRDFTLWKDYHTIAAEYDIFVYPRPGVNVPGTDYHRLKLVDAPLSGISSTEIRHRIATGQDIREYVPHEALDLIVRNYKIK